MENITSTINSHSSLSSYTISSSLRYLVAGLLVSTYYTFKLFSNFRKLPLPPGPKGWPIIGNLLEFPKKRRSEVFSKWGDTYGDIVYLNVLGKPMLILNTQKSAVHLLDKKSAIYSDRAVFTFAGELVGWNKALGLTSYGQQHREMRKHIHAVIGAKNGEQFFELEEIETKRFLRKLRDSPDKFIDHCRWVTGAIILKMTYGRSVAEYNDTDINNANRVMTEFFHATESGTWLVDLIPSLKYIPSWFPGGGFKRIAKEYKESGKDTVDKPFNDLKARINSPTEVVVPNFVTNLLDSFASPTKEDEDLIMWSASNMFRGGSDTTVSALITFFLAMTHFPRVQRKAQAEIDSIVFPSGETPRLPTFADRACLPYTTALVKEVLRWGPISPVGMPHRLTKEDLIEDKGWRVPAGTLVFVNMEGIAHDPKVYPEPDAFNPERYLGANPQPDPTLTMFGHGRRICPGRVFAQQSLFINIACILATFDISPKGNLLPKIEYVESLVNHPRPFECAIKPRNGRM